MDTITIIILIVLGLAILYCWIFYSIIPHKKAYLKFIKWLPHGTLYVIILSILGIIIYAISSNIIIALIALVFLIFLPIK